MTRNPADMPSHRSAPRALKGYGLLPIATSTPATLAPPMSASHLDMVEFLSACRTIGEAAQPMISPGGWSETALKQDALQGHRS